MNNISIRQAVKTDAQIITELNLQAGGGVAEFLLTGLIPNVSPKQMMQHQIESDEAPYSYQFVIVAELDNRVVGSANFYPSEFNHVPDASEESFIPFDRTNAVLAPMYRHCPKNTIYLHALAVLPEYQGKRIGKKLLDYVKNIAKEKKQAVTLHAWMDNHRAIKLYENEGFKIIERIEIKCQPLLPHDGGMVLMQFN